MPTTVSEFEDGTAFERYVLDRATPLLPTPQGTSVIELGENNSTGISIGPPPVAVRVGVSDSTRSPSDQLSSDDIRPLLFGAAWKVIDQLAELALEQAGVQHNRGRDYTISLKVSRAANNSATPVAPFDIRTDLWTRIMATYASTEVLRNSLVHRQLTVDRSTGNMSGTPRPREAASAPLTTGEQSAFCQVAAGAAEAIIHGQLPTRRANQLAWALDQLTSLHGQPSLCAAPAQGLIPVATVRPVPGPSNGIILDITDINNRARAAVAGVSYYDLEIHLPDGRILAAPLEDAGQGLVTIDIASPPAWLRWV